MSNTNYRVFLFSSDVGRLTFEDDFATEEEAKARVEQWIGDRDWAEEQARGMFKIEQRLNSHLKGKWRVSIGARPLENDKQMEGVLNKISMSAINKNTKEEIERFSKELADLQASQRKQQKVILQGEFPVYEVAMLEIDRAIDNFLLEEDPRLYGRIQRQQRADGIHRRFMTDGKPFGYDIYKGEYAVRWSHDEENTTIEDIEAIQFHPGGYYGPSECRSFVVKSGALRVTDPCYEIDTWCAGQIEGVKNGDWAAQAGFYREGQCDYSKERWDEVVAKFKDGDKEMEELLTEGRKEKGQEIDDKTIAGIRAFIALRRFEDLNRYGNPDDWSGRIAYLHIRHTSVDPAEFNETNFQIVEGLDVGVDSGQAGFFDLEAFKLVAATGETKRRDGSAFEVFYEACGEQTLHGDGWGPVNSMGVVSSSGFGDGGYRCYVRRDEEGQVVEARIIYIADDEEEEGDE